MVARWKVDLFLLRPRWRALSTMEDTTQRRTSCPGNQEWRRVCEPNLRTDAFFITRSLTCRAYGRCHCRAGKKPAFWINPTGSSPSHPVEHPLPGGTGHLVGMEFTSSISSLSSNATIEFFEFATHKITPIWTLTKSPGCRIVNICRWQVHFVCSKRTPAIQHHVGEKLPLKSSKTVVKNLKSPSLFS